MTLLSQDGVPVRPADFGLVATHPRAFWPKLCAGAIRWGTDSKYNHGFLVVAVHGDTVTIVEAGGAGTTRGPLHYDPKTVLWSSGHFGLTDAERDGIVVAAEQFAAAKTPYGWWDIVCIALAQRRLGPLRLFDASLPLAEQPWLTRLILKRISSTKTMICSQEIDACWALGGVHIFRDGRWPGLVSPGDLARRVIALPLFAQPATEAQAEAA